MKKEISKNKHKSSRHWIKRTLIGIVAFVILVVILLRLTPFPGALFIRWVFDSSGKKTLKKLETHAPKQDITVIKNQNYNQSNPKMVLDVYFPTNTKQLAMLPTIIWTHGGAWLSGSKDDAAPYFKILAAEGFTVVAPNYPLAPGSKYPEPIHQLNQAHHYVLENAEEFHIDSSRLFLAGDSAGAQLSSQLAALITNPSYASQVGIAPSIKPDQLKGVILNCGIYKMAELAHPLGPVPKIIGWGDDVSVWAYAGTNNIKDPIIHEMSPFYHVTRSYPATFITGGNGDLLTDVQSKPFSAKLKSLNVPTAELYYPENHQPALPHEYQFNLDNDDGKEALKQIIDFVKTRLE